MASIMSSAPNRTNVKLAKLFYKYADESPKEMKEKKEDSKPEEQKTEYESYPPYNFSWFIEKKVAAMGCPKTIENLNYLVESGINHLITLSPEKLPPVHDFNGKLKWTMIGIEEFGTPTLKQVIKFIEICERAEMKGEVIGVHCRQGIGRTGTMLACYLVHFKNMGPERAVLTVRVQRPGSCETYGQEKVACHYYDCVRGTVTRPDYRLVDDKVYFDCAMKYTYPDEDEEVQVDEETVDFDMEKPSVEEIIERHRPKSKAMPIDAQCKSEDSSKDRHDVLPCNIQRLPVILTEVSLSSGTYTGTWSSLENLPARATCQPLPIQTSNSSCCVGDFGSSIDLLIYLISQQNSE